MRRLPKDTFYTTQKAVGIFYRDDKGQAWEMRDLTVEGAKLVRLPELPDDVQPVDETGLEAPYTDMCRQIRETIRSKD